MLQIKNLNIEHRRDLRVILENFNLVLNTGDKAVIIGEEGNGKSTLLKWIFDPALVAAYAECGGERILGAERLSYLPQELPDERKGLSVYEFFSATDAFFVAFKLPNLLRRVFAEGAFAQAFVPILAEYKETRSPEATQAFVRHVAGMLSFVLVIVTALGILAAPWVIVANAPGFINKPDKVQLSIDLLRVVFPYILLALSVSPLGSIYCDYYSIMLPKTQYSGSFLSSLSIYHSI